MRTAIAGLSAVVIAISTPGVPASQSFSLTINAVHKRVLSGDQVALTITLTNNSDSSQWREQPMHECEGLHTGPQHGQNITAVPEVVVGLD